MLTSVLVANHVSFSQRVCQQLGVPDECVYHFALFLLQRKESGDFCVARKLQAYESPYLAQRASSALKLYLRKASWDAAVDEQLMAHPTTLNLLYVQTLAEVERGWIQATAETKRQLASMQARGAKREVRTHVVEYVGSDWFVTWVSVCMQDKPDTGTIPLT